MDTEDKRLIRQVRLENLLSFGPGTPQLELENLNVLIGPNGSGKSNFIEAIALMRSTPGDFNHALGMAGGSADLIWKGSDKHKASIELVVFGFAGLLRHRISILSFTENAYLGEELIEDAIEKAANGLPLIYFKKGDSKSLILKVVDDEWSLQEVELTDSGSILSQIKERWSYPEITLLGESYNQIRIYRIWIFGKDTPLRFPQKADMPRDYLMEDLSNLGLFLNRISQHPPAKKAILAGLQDLYEGIDDFGMDVKGGTIQVFFTEGDFTIPATRLSDGTLRYLCLLAILCDPEPPPLICIEEPELGLHPDVIVKLAKHLIDASTRTQLIVTTHSDILVDALSDTPESVVVCEKHDGKTEMTRLKADEMKVWLDKYRLGQLWISGEIGGTRW